MTDPTIEDHGVEKTLCRVSAILQDIQVNIYIPKLIRVGNCRPTAQLVETRGILLFQSSALLFYA